MSGIITITGKINSNGTIACGTEFTVEHPYTGVYIIQFDKPFIMQEPEIKITFSDSYASAMIIYKSFNSFKCFTIKMEKDNMTLKDYNFNFTATGIQELFSFF